MKESLGGELWVNAMQENLVLFETNEVCKIDPRLNLVNVIGTKWVYKNKFDENGYVTRNKTRLMAQSYT